MSCEPLFLAPNEFPTQPTLARNASPNHTDAVGTLDGEYASLKSLSVLISHPNARNRFGSLHSDKEKSVHRFVAMAMTTASS